MTVRQQLALLDLSTPGGVPMTRWHSRREWQSFSWEGATWTFQPFEHSGVAMGGSLDDGQAGLSFPRLSALEQILTRGHRDCWRGRLRVLHWDDDVVTSGAPPSAAAVVATCRGVLAIASMSLTALEASLDASLMTVAGGGMFPPTVATSSLIGVPVVIGGKE